jgi:hypothetical protein
MKDDEKLTCDHCGGDAITSPNGLFYDGQGEKCDECGMPGHVSVDDSDFDDATASWVYDDEARCTRPDCEECKDA